MHTLGWPGGAELQTVQFMYAHEYVNLTRAVVDYYGVLSVSKLEHLYKILMRSVTYSMRSVTYSVRSVTYSMRSVTYSMRSVTYSMRSIENFMRSVSYSVVNLDLLMRKKITGLPQIY